MLLSGHGATEHLANSSQIIFSCGKDLDFKEGLDFSGIAFHITLDRYTFIPLAVLGVQRNSIVTGKKRWICIVFKLL